MTRKLLVVLLPLALVICGCGVSTRGAERHVAAAHPNATAVNSSGAVALAQRAPGSLIIDGTTQGSLTAPAARAYQAAGGTDRVTIRNAGVNVAFSELCRGQIDMVDSSSPISNAEVAQCERTGIRPVQLEIASDAVVLATKAETDVGADCLTVPEVTSILRAGSPVYNWGQLGFDQVPLSVAGPGPGNAAFGFISRYVLGSLQASLLDFRSDYLAQTSDQSIRQFVTGSASDTAVASGLTQLRQKASTETAILAGAQKTLTDANLYVKEASFQVTKGITDGRSAAAQQQDTSNLASAKTKQKLAQAAVLRQNSGLASTQGEIAAGQAAQTRLAGDLGHLGVFRFSYYGLYEDVLRPLEITTSGSPENCIFPSQQTVTTGAYPLSRPLLITTSVQDAKHADVRDFLLSYLRNAQRLATQQGLVELPIDVLANEEAYFGGPQPAAAAGSSDPS